MLSLYCIDLFFMFKASDQIHCLKRSLSNSSNSVTPPCCTLQRRMQLRIPHRGFLRRCRARNRRRRNDATFEAGETQRRMTRRRPGKKVIVKRRLVEQTEEVKRSRKWMKIRKKKSLTKIEKVDSKLLLITD